MYHVQPWDLHRFLYWYCLKRTLRRFWPRPSHWGFCLWTRETLAWGPISKHRMVLGRIQPEDAHESQPPWRQAPPKEPLLEPRSQSSCSNHPVNSSVHRIWHAFEYIPKIQAIQDSAQIFNVQLRSLTGNEFVPLCSVPAQNSFHELLTRSLVEGVYYMSINRNMIYYWRRKRLCIPVSIIKAYYASITTVSRHWVIYTISG